MNILIYAGFYKSNNGERLLFNLNKLNKLKDTKKLLLSSITLNEQIDIQQSLQRLIKDGFTKEEAKNALSMSMDKFDDQKQNVNVCNYKYYVLYVD